MKKSTKIVGSVASIVMSASLIVGGTYALFTSESEVNIAVTAGKVKVLATIDDDFITYSMGKKTAVNGVFDNRGTAAFDQNADLVLERVAPGDKVEFDINVDNQSNIDIQYRVSMSVEGELADVLVSTVDGVTFMDGQASAWTFDGYEDNDGEAEFVIPVSIELPKDVGDDYQEKNANVTFKVEAVQANGLVGVDTVEGLKEALADGQSVSLTQDLTIDEAIEVTGDAVIFGNGNTIVNNGSRGFQVTAAGASLTLDGVVLDMTNATTDNSVRGINVATTDAVVNLSNTTIRTAANNDNYGINLTGATANVTVNVENSTIEAFQCINVYGPDCTVNLTDTTLIAKANGKIYARQGIMAYVDGVNSPIDDPLAKGTNLTVNTYGTTMIVDGSPEAEAYVNDKGELCQEFVALRNPKEAKAALNNYGTLVINDGYWENENINEQGAAVIDNYGTLVINDGVIGSDLNRGAAVQNKGGEVTINGGTFATIDRGYEGTTPNGDAFAYVFINKSGTMTVNSATVDGNPNGIFYANAGTIVVNDGSYKIGDGAKNTWHVAYAEDGAAIVLNGGKYEWTAGPSCGSNAFGGTGEITDNIPQDDKTW